MQKNSPIKPHVDKYIRLIIESGLASKWLSDAIFEFQSNTEADPPEAVVDLKKLFGGFIALGVGLAIGVILLIGEIFVFKYITQRSPTYDKLLIGIKTMK